MLTIFERGSQRVNVDLSDPRLHRIFDQTWARLGPSVHRRVLDGLGYAKTLTVIQAGAEASPDAMAYAASGWPLGAALLVLIEPHLARVDDDYVGYVVAHEIFHFVLGHCRLRERVKPAHRKYSRSPRQLTAAVGALVAHHAASEWTNDPLREAEVKALCAVHGYWPNAGPRLEAIRELD